jgi:hypothetical protein
VRTTRLAHHASDSVNYGSHRRGVLLWLVNTFISMAGFMKSILNAVVVICVIVWLLNVFGMVGPSYRVHAPTK